jgi:hypothetical protein
MIRVINTRSSYTVTQVKHEDAFDRSVGESKIGTMYAHMRVRMQAKGFTRSGERHEAKNHKLHGLTSPVGSQKHADAHGHGCATTERPAR